MAHVASYEEFQKICYSVFMSHFIFIFCLIHNLFSASAYQDPEEACTDEKPAFVQKDIEKSPTFTAQGDEKWLLEKSITLRKYVMKTLQDNIIIITRTVGKVTFSNAEVNIDQPIGRPNFLVYVAPKACL